jgi:multiple sugar transport system permease protein
MSIRSRVISVLHTAAAVLVVAAFMAPLGWWALTSLKPLAAQFDREGIVALDFVPTLGNYALAFGPDAPEIANAWQAVADTVLVAAFSTALTLAVSLPAAFAMSRHPSRRRDALLAGFVLFRFVPPIALIIPMVFLFRDVGLFDTRAGLVIAHSVLNLPLALLMLKSFFDDVPREIDEAARLDGASSGQVFWRMALPLVREGVAATAVLCLVFSWTEFLMSVFLTVSFRTLPVKMASIGTASWGPVAALGTAAMLPAFVFVLLMRGHLVRGLTLGGATVNLGPG